MSSHHCLTLMYMVRYNIEIIKTKQSQYTQYSCNNVCGYMFLIVKHVKSNINVSRQ
jgi:hypothetical protein